VCYIGCGSTIGPFIPETPERLQVLTRADVGLRHTSLARPSVHKRLSHNFKYGVFHAPVRRFEKIGNERKYHVRLTCGEHEKVLEAFWKDGACEWAYASIVTWRSKLGINCSLRH
jgi:hypothetical protein